MLGSAGRPTGGTDDQRTVVLLGKRFNDEHAKGIKGGFSTSASPTAAIVRDEKETQSRRERLG